MGATCASSQFAFLSKREPISRLLHNSSPESQGNFYVIVLLLNCLPQHQPQPMLTAKKSISSFHEKIKIFDK